MNQEQERAEAEHQLLEASFMGDIREDVQVLGLSMADIAWIVVVTFVVGGFPFLLPVHFLIKIGWFLVVFFFYSAARYMQVPYRLRRYVRYKRIPKTGSGEKLDEFLGAQSEAWLFRSKTVWQMVVRLEAPPWRTAVLNQKRMRIQAYEQFLRACAKEKIVVSISSRQVPDFKWELWQAKADKPKATEGIAQLTNTRMAMWEDLANSTNPKRKAERSDYLLRLAIDETNLTLMERDDEPQGASKEELRRFRILADLREKKNLVLPILEDARHKCSLLSGYAVAEALAESWDPIAWKDWKATRGGWDDPEEKVVDGPNAVGPAALSTVSEEAAASLEEKPSEKEKTKKEKKEKGARFRKWLTVGQKLSHNIFSFLVTLGVRFASIVRSRRNPRVIIEADGGEPDEHPYAEDIPLLQSPEPPDKTSVTGASEEARVVIVTAPAPTGKSFVAANVAIAHSSVTSSVALVDLSPDKGSLSVINPIRDENQSDGWQMYVSRRAPGFTLWLPTSPEALIWEQLQTFVETLAGQGRVMIDMPWTYPWRKELFTLGLPVAVIDADYHHWTIWERSIDKWDGEIWQNRQDVDMDDLVREQFGRPVTRRLPTYESAQKALFQGSPLGLEEAYRKDFWWPKGGNPAC